VPAMTVEKTGMERGGFAYRETAQIGAAQSETVSQFLSWTIGVHPCRFWVGEASVFHSCRS
jgi:hypothetical protein